VITTLKTVYDPEIPVNIFEMGMIYETRANVAGQVYVKMTLTSPMCPVAGSLPGEVEGKVKKVEGVTAAKVDLVWEPQWQMSMISEAARLQLNLP
jgi:FeS assembly SUF system protein